MFKTEIIGLTAKELCDNYPALGGLKIICRLMTEGTLLPYRVIQALGSNKYEVKSISYSNFGIDRRNILGKPVGDILISACDKYPYDGPYFFDPNEVIFETSAITKLLEAYPDIITSEVILFQIDQESGEVIHPPQQSARKETQPAAGNGDLTWLFNEREELQQQLDSARKEIKRLQKKNDELSHGKESSAKTQAGRDKLAEDNAKSWMGQLEVAVELTSTILDKWENKEGSEPWAKEGFTNSEIKSMAGHLGGLTQNGRRAFKKAFIRCYPDVLLKTTSGARCS